LKFVLTIVLFKVGQKFGQPVTINADGSINSENQVKPQTTSHVAKRAGDDEGAQPPPKKPLQVTLETVVWLSFCVGVSDHF
jgi:hypothetical protein